MIAQNHPLFKIGQRKKPAPGGGNASKQVERPEFQELPIYPPRVGRQRRAAWREQGRQEQPAVREVRRNQQWSIVEFERIQIGRNKALRAEAARQSVTRRVLRETLARKITAGRTRCRSIKNDGQDGITADADAGIVSIVGRKRPYRNAI
ncbi:hypothetical protein [Mesorhizobium sp. CO1-1-8]|uniref:hypothetical protein n=1 Tax=Mesorhizobium sp. CO1-1-8 TaxID=2876631 RepID=UPI001CD06ED5|nr:hypothetical protein [Mesorhizobium sp. CO1-1-8]MBZ9772325.1 hypothetical protein [Mesorhizobium sp. CO1-1-8]